MALSPTERLDRKRVRKLITTLSKKTDIIIFSKQRTLQLGSLIRSLQLNSDVIPKDINVLFKTSPDIPYQSLMAKYDCRFIEEKDFFADLKELIEASQSRYVLFMVDDLICRDQFSLAEIESFLDARSDIDCFSLRLGRNIVDHPAPKFLPVPAQMLIWDTSDDLGYTWKYFWEVSSSIYRKDHVLDYFSKSSRPKVSYPNGLETHYYRCMPSCVGSGLVKLVNSLRFLGSKRSRRMACFEKSKCFTQGVNLVAARQTHIPGVFDPLDLHKKMEEGFVIDSLALKNINNVRPNVGAKYFQLVKETSKTCSG